MAGRGGLADHGADRCSRDQRPRAIPIGEHGSAARLRAIEMACGRDLEALHPAREGDAIRGLDDELEPTGTNREMNDPKVAAAEAALQRALDRAPRALIV
jgi:hypothetical protein